jgi:DNA-binding FadR family transcriptional regulator
MSKDEKNLSEITAEHLLKMIGHDKTYHADDKLPNELQLAEMLNVSRSTLREAVRILSAGGVLEIRRGLGTFVTNTPSPNYNELNQFAASAASTQDAFELRLMFEPKCAYLAALRATDEEISTILKNGKALITKLQAGEQSTEEDQIFHESIADATHNVYVSDLMPIVFQGIHQSTQLLESESHFFSATLTDTQLIMDFMSSRNAEGARTAMELHILHAMQYLDKRA